MEKCSLVSFPGPLHGFVLHLNDFVVDEMCSALGRPYLKLEIVCVSGE